VVDGAGFGVFVLAMLAVDMFLLGRHGAQKVTLCEALTWSLVWFAMAMLFGGALWGGWITPRDVKWRTAK